MLTAEYVRSRLTYDSDTGRFYWKPKAPEFVAWNTRYAGRQTGHFSMQDGYVRISLDKRLYLAHRVAWLITHGEWPPEHLDHINGDQSDNRIANLRVATRAENNQNARVRKDNTTGFKGVSRIGKRFVAACSFNGKRHYLGCFASAQEAAAAYSKFAAERHGRFFKAAAPPLAAEGGRLALGDTKQHAE